MPDLETCNSPEDTRREGATPVRDEPSVELLGLRQRLKRSDEVASRHATMLREGDHRIKNSLQIVSSMIALQARQETSPSARAALHAAAARVQSIGRIHDALQAGAGEDVVDLGHVLATMCASLQELAGNSDRMAVIVDVGDRPMLISSATAQPVVLAVNELVINALRHAFPGDRAGVVRVTLAPSKYGLSVVVADDGVGLPADYAEGRGFGLTLVRMMAAQVLGEFHIDRQSGTKLSLLAPLPATPDA